MPTETIIIVMCSFLTILIAVALIFLWRRLNYFFQGKNAVSLEEHINKLTEAVRTLENEKEVMVKNIKLLEKKTTESIRGVGAVRFNAFVDAGGNQSFAVALLNEKGDGVILSSLYAREKTSVFAKPVSQLKSEYELLPEEKRALDKAKL